MSQDLSGFEQDLRPARSFGGARVDVFFGAGGARAVYFGKGKGKGRGGDGRGGDGRGRGGGAGKGGRGGVSSVSASAPWPPVEFAIYAELPPTAPSKVQKHVKEALGVLVFTRREESINDRPSYIQVNKAGHAEQLMMWSNKRSADVVPMWFIGRTARYGTNSGWFCVRDEATEPSLITGMWEVSNNGEEWSLAPNIKLLHASVKHDGDDGDDVAVIGSRTPEERNAEGRKHAIDLDDDERPRKRAALAAMGSRVATARSLCSSAVDARYRELFQPAFEEYSDDMIDEAELGRRKVAARAKAMGEHGPLAELDEAYAAFTAACSKLEAAAAHADAAEAQLEAALDAVQPAAAAQAAAGPSGTVKSERRSELQSESPA